MCCEDGSCVGSSEVGGAWMMSPPATCFVMASCTRTVGPRRSEGACTPPQHTTTCTPPPRTLQEVVAAGLVHHELHSASVAVAHVAREPHSVAVQRLLDLGRTRGGVCLCVLVCVRLRVRVRVYVRVHARARARVSRRASRRGSGRIASCKAHSGARAPPSKALHTRGAPGCRRASGKPGRPR